MTALLYLGDGFGGTEAVGGLAFGGADAAGLALAAGGFASSNSTSKIKVEFGAMSGPTARSP